MLLRTRLTLEGLETRENPVGVYPPGVNHGPVTTPPTPPPADPAPPPAGTTPTDPNFVGPPAPPPPPNPVPKLKPLPYQGVPYMF